MKRIVMAGTLVLLAPALAACSSSDAPAGGSAPGAGSGSVAGPTTGSGNAAGGLCEMWFSNLVNSERAQELSSGMSDTLTQALADGDVAVINDWGKELEVVAGASTQFYQEGRQYIEGDDLLGAWDLLTQFSRDFSLTVATEAANASNTEDFAATITALVSDPNIQSSVNFAPAASQMVSEHLAATCGEPPA